MINIIIIIIIIIVIIIMLFLYSPSVVFMVQKPVGPRKQLKQSIVVNITGLRKSTGGKPVGYLFNKRDRGCQLGTTENKSGQQDGTWTRGLPNVSPALQPLGHAAS